jgi:hypothetical protein
MSVVIGANKHIPMMVKSTVCPIEDETKQFDALLTLLRDLLQSNQSPLIIRLETNTRHEGWYYNSSHGIWGPIIIKALDSIRLIDHM